MTILNVDDDIEDAAFFSEAIRKINPEIKCILLNDSIKAQDLLVNESELPKIDFIFLDINMPKMNGFELLEVIKKDKRLKEIPVYMYSTSSSEKEMTRINSLGAKLLQKQNDLKSTVNLLANILTKE